MSYTATIQYFDNYIRVTTSGSIDSIEELFEYAALLAQKGEEYATTRALLDERTLVNRTDVMDAYTLSESNITAESAMKGVRIASLITPESMELGTVFETILRNRSLNFKIFTDEKKAIAWLTA
ncbi:MULTISPECIES: hypothetical protein [unclassified Pseudodesulfovibrio]|uniref:hypothetical protein n=1 Tax=unclassified Pseudodesulfovibrio TaxID=2661612 RepID=UPI000FEC07FA|nr:MULTISPECIES: hypothetical protein [unclassified Pseudodesulfovibrio]MCJ2165745.1 hypothetical protein [Pseudodesulfovibrio sp. S3-i]RWU02884.1 hypothetical protein DWB63_14010 [Pseudodesulfovibrio sp. S3]